MREIAWNTIRDTVAQLAIRANTVLDTKVEEAIRQARTTEESPVGLSILDQLLENSQIARETATPICQDTGLAVVFVTIGQEVHITGGSLEEAIHAGVAKGYTEGYLRKSVARDPLDRVNTGDNTPAIIHYKIVPGDTFLITVAPKGIGSENMSRIFMLKPSQGLAGIRQAVLDTVLSAGSNALSASCHRRGGVGGNFEKCAQLAKEALLRPIGQYSQDPAWAQIEKDLLLAVNDLGIGATGLRRTDPRHSGWLWKPILPISAVCRWP